jgi:CRP-like cAMP-binding protein
MSKPTPSGSVLDADGPAYCVTLTGASVRETVVACEPFRELLFASLAQRLAGLMALLEELVARRLDSRLAALLVERAPVLHLTHQQLADELASAREVVSRLLEGFEPMGT